jgi:hypothetical protein
MHLIYLDDSGFHKRRQIACATIIRDEEFQVSEGYMGYIIEQHVPEELRPNFEFHASELFHGKPPFDAITEEERPKIFLKCISMISQTCLGIVYSCVDVDKLKKGAFATANPADIAFRLCLPELERWFEEKAPENFGILICDEPSEKQIRNIMQASFREKRGKIRTHYEMKDGKVDSISEERGELKHLHDDMYFGSSNCSVGIQQADMCAYIIHRHLSGKEDAEKLYKLLEPLIFAAKHAP